MLREKTGGRIISVQKALGTLLCAEGSFFIAPIVLQTACMAIVIVYVQRKLKTHFRQ
jgi:hypothetical protein